ncbi:unnamed protein product [Vicia faba]|uniref:Uncharacterized protein n=1 Tax=Vicia faba TaxID=3906 RepID=A0AAV0Z6G1_VICFA|nr:unnamed protein product [Vicia faba]
MDIVRCNPAREDWWVGSSPSGPFIYTPFSKGDTNNMKKQELVMIVGEPIQVLVELEKPLGPVTIPGCIVHYFGVITEHLFREVDNLLLGAAQGLVLSDPFRCCGSPKLKNVFVPNIYVVPPFPLLISHVVGGNGAIILYEREIRDVWISLANAETIPIEQAHILLLGKNQDSVISYSSETLKSRLPLKPGAEVKFPVTL